MSQLDSPAQSLLASHQSLLSIVRQASAVRRAPVILVGGAVRDLLMGMPLADLDFAVQGDAVALARAVANALRGDFYIMDDARGTARVILKGAQSEQDDGAMHSRLAASLSLDFSVCRGDTWEEDLLARDFTVNAIAIDLGSNAILDPTGGRADLERQIIRQTRAGAIEDDPVRAVRAVRMSLALSAAIEPATAAAVRLAAPLLSRPSPERVRDELLKILSQRDAARGARMLDDFGLLGVIAPEIESMRGCEQSPPHRFNVLEHTFVVLDYADMLLSGQIDPALHFNVSDRQRAQLADHFAAPITADRPRAAIFRLALLLHDSGKPQTRSDRSAGNAEFPNHPAIGAGLATRRARALKLSGDETQHVKTIVQHHMRPNLMARAGEVSLRALYRLWRDVRDCLPELALLCVADGMGKAGADTPLEDRQRRGRMAELILDAYYTRFAPGAAPDPLIHGEDVLALGVARGPKIGQLIEAVREAQMAGEIATRAEALALLRRIAAGDQHN
ncbi:MAG: CCA tRNA nucleotidyltransferase [Candidatus Roseilinea sp.]|uniref:CCA tRNA nucleotidyltransferase n=1 Tax=Candidatus Roseilinea sp. TaxID=2838777 RepID=UPI00404AC5E9